MKPLKKTILYTGKFLKLIKEGHWEYAERTNASGAVIIVAVTEEGKLLLVEQYRIPLHCQTIELPAGIVGDEPGGAEETFVDAAKRELLEEAGYSAEHVEILTTGPSSAGLASELITLVMASGLKRVNAGGGIGNEKITVHEIPVETVHDWLRAQERKGLMVEPKVFAGLYFLFRREK